MGCKKSKKYSQICDYDELKFKNMLDEYCGKDGNGQSSDVDNQNYGLFNIVSDSEKMDAREYVSTSQCPWHVTDTLECLILGFILAIVMKFLYSKWQTYRVKKAERKLNNIKVIYKQALESKHMAPTAPLSYNPVPTVKPYAGVSAEVEKLNK